jgi:hypothetical protein
MVFVFPLEQSSVEKCLAPVSALFYRTFGRAMRVSTMNLESIQNLGSNLLLRPQ